jgi:hypothetical protein
MHTSARTDGVHESISSPATFEACRRRRDPERVALRRFRDLVELIPERAIGWCGRTSIINNIDPD